MELQRSVANNTNHLKFQNYLNASELFLQQRNFEDCRNYALKAIEVDPNQTTPSQILTIASVLLLSTTINEDPNYYSILNLPLYTQNQQLIRTNFMHMSNLLNLNQNMYPFASEAFGYVLKAWSVLSSPTHKIHFDNELKNKEKNKNTFWTVCPYCYCVYEFVKDYEDCCLRCQNAKCRRVFHGVSIVGPPPPPEVVENGQYHCFGFSALGQSLWSPFVGTKINQHNVESEIVGEKTNEKNIVLNDVIVISDDEEEDENGEKERSVGVEANFVETNSGEVDKGDTSMGCNLRKKRRKMMAKSLNKILGKGNKVDMNEIAYNLEENDDFEFGNVAENLNENNVESGIREKGANENNVEFDNNVGETINENNIEFDNVGETINENNVEFDNVSETTDKNNFEHAVMEDDDMEFFMRENIYDQMKKHFDIEFF